jgi:probable HAF family extracellular repeat protein
LAHNRSRLSLRAASAANQFPASAANEIKRGETKMKRFAFTLTLALLFCTSMWAQGSYTFQTVNYPGDTFTQVLGINNSLLIAGYHNFNSNSGFTLKLPLGFTTENFPNSAMTQVIGINNTGTSDGFYVDNGGTTHGFYKTGSTFTNVDYPGTAFNQLLGQNDMGQASGYYSLSSNNTTPDFPYVYNELGGGVFQVITIPAAVGGAQATGINNSQQISGFYIDSAGVNHGFLLNFGLLVTLDAPGSTFTQALGLNNKGQVVGQYMDAAGNTHGFVWTSAGGFTTIDEPSGVGTTVVNGINDRGMLVGFYGTAPINSGFVAFPR